MRLSAVNGTEDGFYLSQDGVCGVDLKWEYWYSDTLKEGILKIVGTGEMYDMSVNLPSRIKSRIKKIEICEGVTSIGTSAFYQFEKVESVTMPSTLVKIGMVAFNQCTSLQKIEIPDSVKTIGNSAFSQCSKLTDVKISKNVKAIPDGAFNKCSVLQKIEIPDGVESIGASAFCYSGLIECTIPDTVKTIGSYAFSGCENLSRVKLPKDITVIPRKIFENCTDLKEVNIPDSVTKINEDAFLNCSSLENLTILRNVTSIHDTAFSGCNSLTMSVCKNSYAESFASQKGINYQVLCENGHSWGEWEEITPPTCTETGEEKRVCSVCKDVEFQDIEANGHTWGDWIRTKEPSCAAEGEDKRECSECDAYETRKIPAKGHLWDEGVITKAPTCTEPGIRTCTCERCKWTIQKEVAPTGHIYAGEITKATFTKDGVVSGVCEDCGASVQREVIPQVSDVELSHTEYTYNGTNRQPKVVLKDRTGKELKPEEYSVAYAKESKVPGTYELTITLKGNYYEGTLTKAYTVKKGNQVIGLSDMTKRIDSKNVTLKAEILQGNKTGRFGYKSSNPEVASVTSWGRVTFHKVGKVEITAMTRGSANYNSAQKTITLTVAPAPTAVTKLQSQNPGKLNIQYRANSEADGYQIQYGTSPDMKGAKYAAIENPAIRSYTRTDAMSEETYYVRVRTYNVVDGERIYSNWSGIKNIEVK